MKACSGEWPRAEALDLLATGNAHKLQTPIALKCQAEMQEESSVERNAPHGLGHWSG